MPTTGAGFATWLGSSGVAAAAATAAVGAVVSKALAPKQAAQTVAPVTTADKPQAAQAVDPAALAKKNALAASAAGALAGNSSTVLSGSQGIAPASLNLGTNTLLGS